MALDHATRENSPDRLVRLLSYPIDANAVGQDGLRLVHILSAIPVLNSVDALLDKLVEHGADLAACDAAGSTALHYAAASGNETMVTKLLERHGALINNARIDDALAGDVAALFGHDRLAARLNRNPAFAAASPGAQGYQTPTQQEYSQLQFLPAGTAWTSLPLPPSRRGGVPSGLPAPLPLPQLLSRISFWRPTACRRAFLYADRWLEETWWRSENGHCGISARVTDSHGNKMVMEVTGTSSAIHEMNTTQPPRPKNEAEALRYLKFFCHSVHGELGPFSLCETEEIVQAHLPASVYHKAESLRYSINVEPGVDGHWQILIPVRYAHGLYQTKFSIAPGGTIEMLDDEPLLDWEGTRDDRPFGSDANIYFYTPKN